MADADGARADQPERPAKRGVPVWLPLAALVGVFALAVLVGARICPVLSALVFPPEPPLPPGDVTLITPQENQGPGRDEWVYGVEAPPCDVLAYYEDRVGGCEYDPEAQCPSATYGTQPRDSGSFLIGVCQATESVGPFYRVTWTTRVGGGYSAPSITRFRITREVAN